MMSKAFRTLESKCRAVIDSADPNLIPMVTKIVSKLQNYGNFFCSEFDELAQTLDLRFASYFLSHSTLLRRYEVVPSLADGEISTEKSSNELQPVDQASFMRSLLNEES